MSFRLKPTGVLDKVRKLFRLTSRGSAEISSAQAKSVKRSSSRTSLDRLRAEQQELPSDTVVRTSARAKAGVVAASVVGTYRRSICHEPCGDSQPAGAAAAAPSAPPPPPPPPSATGAPAAAGFFAAVPLHTAAGFLLRRTFLSGLTERDMANMPNHLRAFGAAAAAWRDELGGVLTPAQSEQLRSGLVMMLGHNLFLVGGASQEAQQADGQRAPYNGAELMSIDLDWCADSVQQARQILAQPQVGLGQVTMMRSMIATLVPQTEASDRVAYLRDVFGLSDTSATMLQQDIQSVVKSKEKAAAKLRQAENNQAPIVDDVEALRVTVQSCERTQAMLEGQVAQLQTSGLVGMDQLCTQAFTEGMHCSMRQLFSWHREALLCVSQITRQRQMLRSPPEMVELIRTSLTRLAETTVRDRLGSGATAAQRAEASAEEVGRRMQGIILVLAESLLAVYPNTAVANWGFYESAYVQDLSAQGRQELLLHLIRNHGGSGSREEREALVRAAQASGVLRLSCMRDSNFVTALRMCRDPQTYFAVNQQDESTQL